MTPEQLLDRQADLADTTARPRYRKLMTAIISSQSKGAPEPDRAAESITAHTSTLARAAYAYRVTHDMCTVVQHAAAQLDASDVFDHDLAPTQVGLVHFDQPLPMLDARGNTMLLHWLLWGPAAEVSERTGLVTHGTVSLWFNDQDELPDYYGAQVLHSIAHVRDKARRDEAQRELGRWGLAAAELTRNGVTVGTDTTPLDPEHALAILADGDTPMPHTNTTRYIHALWLLLGQTITTVEREHVRKTAGRLAERRGVNPAVTVVRLRRSESPHAGERRVDWAARWLVRGHWRWQPYGPGREERRRIWITGYVKGPDGLPLRVRNHVYSLDR